MNINARGGLGGPFVINNFWPGRDIRLMIYFECYNDVVVGPRPGGEGGTAGQEPGHRVDCFCGGQASCGVTGEAAARQDAVTGEAGGSGNDRQEGADQSVTASGSGVRTRRASTRGRENTLVV